MARRRKPRMTPSKRKNPSGKEVWVARYMKRDGTFASAGTFKRKGDAQDAIDAAHAVEWDRSAAVVTRDTIGEYAKDWTDRHPRSERTNRTNRSRVDGLLDVEIDGLKLRDWTWTEVQRRQVIDLIDYMLREQGRAAEGARNVIRAFSAMAEDAITDGVRPINLGNPFKGTRILGSDARVTKPPREPRLLTLEEMRKFAAAAGRNEPMVRMLSDCGLRVGEMLGLQRALQDLKDGFFTVKGSAWNGKLIESSTTKKHDRRGPIPPTVLAMLRAMPPRIDTPWLFSTPGAAHTRKPRIDWPTEEELQVRLTGSSYKALSRELGVSDNALRNRMRAYAAGRQPGDGPHNGGGCLWRYDNWMRDVWRPAREVTGMDVDPHDFRHSWNSILRADRDIDAADVAKIAGNDVKTNDAVYTHALEHTYDRVREVIG